MKNSPSSPSPSPYDPLFQEFHEKEVDYKKDFFLKDGRLFDVIFSRQLDRSIIDQIYLITNKLRALYKDRRGAMFLSQLLGHKRAMLYFNQPSSRTYLSFENACHILGMRTSEIRDTNVSSEVKGEGPDDAIRTFSSYTDLIIMRTLGKDQSERASWMFKRYSKRRIPVINGGSGADEHPTQALLDIYTLQRSFANRGGLDGKTLLLCGDLKRGRTVRSLCYLMNQFTGIKLIFTAPEFFQMRPDILEFLDMHKIPYRLETKSLHRCLGEADAVYMTRIQDEHDTQNESGVIDMAQFKLSLADLKLMKDDSVILHPFPRRDEIDVRIDEDPRAKYWRQERNGMWTRAALIAYVFQVDQEILDFKI